MTLVEKILWYHLDSKEELNNKTQKAKEPRASPGLSRR